MWAGVHVHIASDCAHKNKKKQPEIKPARLPHLEERQLFNWRGHAFFCAGSVADLKHQNLANFCGNGFDIG